MLDVEGDEIVNPFDQVQESKSSSLSGVTYYEQGLGQKLDGGLLINTMRTEVRKIMLDDTSALVEKNIHKIRLRQLTRDQLCQMAERSGLQLMEERDMGQESIFAFRLR